MSRLRLAAVLAALPLALGVTQQASAHAVISLGIGLPGFGYPAYAAPPVAYAPAPAYPAYSYSYGYGSYGYPGYAAPPAYAAAPAYEAAPVYVAPRRHVVHHVVRRPVVRHDYCACNYH